MTQYKVSATNSRGCTHPDVITISAKTLRTAKMIASKIYEHGWDLHLWACAHNDVYCVTSKIDGVWEDAK